MIPGKLLFKPYLSHQTSSKLKAFHEGFHYKLPKATRLENILVDVVYKCIQREKTVKTKGSFKAEKSINKNK